jgi:hypothetical protein
VVAGDFDALRSTSVLASEHFWRDPRQKAQSRNLSSSILALGVDAALADRIRHAVDRQHVRGDAVIDVVCLSIANHIVE